MNDVNTLMKSIKEDLIQQGFEISLYKLELYMDTALKVVRLINKFVHSKEDIRVTLGIVRCMYDLISVDCRLNN